jgi:hypothetical protein
MIDTLPLKPPLKAEISAECQTKIVVARVSFAASVGQVGWVNAAPVRNRRLRESPGVEVQSHLSFGALAADRLQGDSARRKTRDS